MNDKAAGMQIDSDLVRQLAELLEETRLTEIEVQDGDRRIRVVRNVSMPSTASQATTPPATISAPPTLAPAAPPASDVVPADHPGTVKSPMVGTAYLLPEPGAEPFVLPGATVAAGDTLLIVEAMKVMNPIVSPRAGKVVQVLIENGQPVEFDQPLVIVE